MSGVNIVSSNAPSTGFASGPSPSGILANKAGTFLYVTDSTLNQVATYSISPTSGVPTLIPTNSTVAQPSGITTDAQPMGMSFDLTGKYLYVAAYTANAVDTYTLGANGVPVRSTVAGSAQTGTGPTCITVSGSPSNANPTHAEYLYTSNQLSGTLTGEQVNQADGSLAQIQGTPFSGSALPTCVVTVPAFPIR
jgi:6-phosphogluconolactonase (cycloisomerase 2 family)